MANENLDIPHDDLSGQAFDGSMQRLLSLNVGNYISCDFLVGTNTVVTKAGILHDVGEKYLVLYQARNRQYIVCDIFNLKFVTFLEPHNI
ncbi:MAG: hypothetical protein RR993_04815 [Clostridia bacterium]